MSNAELTDRAADLLSQAADIIEERGHCKFTLVDDEGAVCLMGGLNAAQYGSVYWYGSDPFDSLGADERIARHAAHQALVAEIGSVDPSGWSTLQEMRSLIEMALVYWNNRPACTQGEVIDTLRHAAKRLRGGA